MCAVMSANDCLDTVRECLQHGACHYIVKPATHKEIMNIWQYVYRGSAVSAQPCTPRKLAAPAVSGPPTSAPLDRPSSTAIAAAPSVSKCDTISVSAGNPTPAGLLVNPLTSTSTNCPLNTVLESTFLPWNTRLSIFCHLLNAAIRAFQRFPSAPSSCTPSKPDSEQAWSPPFTSPEAVLVSSAGDVSTCCAPPRHFSTPFYSAPEQPAHLHGRRGCDSAQATYALGVLLMELAMAPLPAMDRSKHLAALPRLPMQLLSSKPAIAVLILQMVCLRPSSRNVHKVAAVSCSYCLL